MRHSVKKSKTLETLNIGVADPVLTQVWQNSAEFLSLTNVRKQGIIGEIAEFSSEDNPYGFCTAEWIFWNEGFWESMDKKLGQFEEVK